MRYCLLIPVLVASLGCSGATTQPTAACTTPQTYTVGGTANAGVGVSDCYQMLLGSQANFRITVTPSGFDAGIGLFAGAPGTSATPTVVFSTVGSGPIFGNAFLPSGTYYFVVNSTNGKAGTYKVESQTVDASACSANSNWTFPGATLSGVITAADCVGGGTARQQIYELQLKQGQSVSVSATLSKPGAVLWRTGGASSADLITRQMLQPGTTSFIYTATADGVYRLHLLGEPSTNGNSSYTASIK